MEPILKIKEEINFDNTHTIIRINGRKKVHLTELPYQKMLNNPQVPGAGNSERDPSSPTLPWPRRPALELTEQKRRVTRVVTLRVRERGGLWKVGHTTMASAKNPHSGVPLALKEKLIRLNGYPKPYPMVVHAPTINRWPPRGGLDSEFPSPWTPAHDRQGLALSDCYERQFGPRLLIGYSQLTYTCTYTCTHVSIYIYTYTYTCTV